MNRGLLLIAALLALSVTSQADGTFTPHFKPTLEVVRCNGQITVDGQLNEAAWQTASVAEDFAEKEPNNNCRPPVSTRVLITYDERKLYLGFICHDDPKTIRASLRDRDDIFEDDYIGFLLDTYGDGAWGYELFANPLGIQGDLRIMSSGSEDVSLDLVWESKGIVTDSGYQVEIAVPFSSLRFPDRPEQTWRATFWRDHQRDVRRQYSWAAMDRKDPCFLCQFGTLTGIKGIKPGSRLDLLPNVIASKTDYLVEEEDGAKRFKTNDPEAALSLNAKYSLSTNATAEMTINPDFSQVESDATQIDVNSPYALYYDEHRPFFQEGQDLFSMNINTVYTRSINDPEVAGKFAGKFDRTSVAYLVARDDHTPLMVPLGDRTEFWRGGKSTSNVVRFKQTFLENSFVGTVATDRRLEGGGSGSVFGGDAKLWFLKNFEVVGQALASHTEEPNNPSLSDGAEDATFERGKHTLAFDGEKYWGHAGYARLEYARSREGAWVSYTAKSPTFRADNGFIERNDTRELDMFGNLFFRPNGKILLTWEPNLQVGRVWNYSGRRIDEWLVPQFELQFTQQTFIWTNYLVSRELFREHYFPGIRRFETGIDSRPCGWLGLGGSVTHGHFVARSEYLKNPVLGHGTNLDTYLDVKLTKRLDIAPQFSYSTLDHPDTAMNLFTEYVIRTRVSYQFTRECFLRLVVDYVHGDQAIYNRDDSTWFRYVESGLRIEPLLSYKLNPFTIFYIGSAGDFGESSPENVFRRYNQHYFAKLQYLFRV